MDRVPRGVDVAAVEIGRAPDGPQERLPGNTAAWALSGLRAGLLRQSEPRPQGAGDGTGRGAVGIGAVGV
jgi:hypothetical protein